MVLLGYDPSFPLLSVLQTSPSTQTHHAASLHWAFWQTTPCTYNDLVIPVYPVDLNSVNSLQTRSYDSVSPSPNELITLVILH